MAFTIKDLRETVKDCNNLFESNGIPLRYREQGRNGYQAVDLMDLTGSCLSNVCTGTARDVAAFIKSGVYQELNYYVERFKGWSIKRNINGHRVVHIKHELNGGFSVQTLGKLSQLHKHAIGKIADATYYIKEVNEYVLAHGTDRQKKIMGLI